MKKTAKKKPRRKAAPKRSKQKAPTPNANQDDKRVFVLKPSELMLVGIEQHKNEMFALRSAMQEKLARLVSAGQRAEQLPESARFDMEDQTWKVRAADCSPQELARLEALLKEGEKSNGTDR